jgi:hypothetical protein
MRSPKKLVKERSSTAPVVLTSNTTNQSVNYASSATRLSGRGSFWPHIT